MKKKIIHPMTPEQIIQALDAVEISQAGLARDLHVSPPLINLVIHGKANSRRVRCHVAKAIRRPVDKIWDMTPLKSGRPLTKGLYDHQAA